MSTPVQRQFWDLKHQNPDAVLFFRLGDFYEMFFEDALLASRILGITLTARHRGTENEMPMCGFPYHAHKEYLETLVDQGYKVAIAEQYEDPETKQISRKISRVVTPGTSLESGNLDPEKNNFIAAITVSGFPSDKGESRGGAQYALAYSDLSTGEFRTAIFEEETTFLEELWKIAPTEILLPTDLFSEEDFWAKLPDQSMKTPRKNLGAKKSRAILNQKFPNLEAFGLEKLESLIEVSAYILDYLIETQKSDLSHIQKIQTYSARETMALDAQTFRHLEIFEPITREEKNATLWSVFERTGTAMGGRKLREWVANPLLSVDKIAERAEGVQEMTEDLGLQQSLAESFKKVADLERILSRLVIGRGNGRDLAFFRDSFAIFPEIAQILTKTQSPILIEKKSDFEGFETLAATLQKSLKENPPLEITAGGIFKEGYHAELDALREMGENSQKWLEKFLEEKKEASGISNLRVKFSKNFGFCLEVSKAAVGNVPEEWTPRQTLVNATRFTTPELAEYETNVLSAESRAFELEHELFLKLREAVLQSCGKISDIAQNIGVLDALNTLSRTATKNRWIRPIIESHKGGSFIEAQKVRHPVVENLSAETFIANDLIMGEKSHFHLVTGPNMAGKSTFLRQSCLLILLGQIGSFVPAKTVRFSVFDRIFTRVGASDNLAGGKSTFFVEMTETASILHAATDKSFVILDEIGRGTSTFDGISLAWAITEFLHETGICTVFATHYHELIDLANDLSGADNFHVSAESREGGILFLRKVKKGGISDSFGIEVAKLAGVPEKIIKNSREVLSRLESENILNGKPNLFSNFTPSSQDISPLDKGGRGGILLLGKEMKNIDPNDLSPKEALEKLYELKKLLGKEPF